MNRTTDHWQRVASRSVSGSSVFGAATVPRRLCSGWALARTVGDPSVVASLRCVLGSPHTQRWNRTGTLATNPDTQSK